MTEKPFEMKFDIGTIKHLGLQMYSTLPPVISELVANAWDADADWVKITVPDEPLTDESEIIVEDNGVGMSDEQVRSAYLVVGRDRREEEGDDKSPNGSRPVMGRKGIGKFSGFGVAQEIEIETVNGRESSRFIMNFEKLKEQAGERMIKMPPLAPTGTLAKGTRVTLRKIEKYRTRRISLRVLRRGLARRFSILGENHDFLIVVNGSEITPEERNLQQYLEKDASGEPYLWEYSNVEIEPGTGWRVSGWIGATDRTISLPDGVGRGIAIMARGKLVQEPFVFDAVVGQQFALSYLIGELHAEFVDQDEDTIATTRNSLVWDTEPNHALKEWGENQVNKVAREWAERRREDNEQRLQENALYQRFLRESNDIEDRALKKVADRLIRDVIKKDLVTSPDEQQDIIQLCIDFLEFDVFRDLADTISGTDIANISSLLKLFRDWEVIEAKEMARVTDGRIRTIQKLQRLIEEDALEVPTLHNFLKEFPWVIDPRWTLVADEQHFSDILRNEFPEEVDGLESNRRIDFLCVREGTSLIVVEIKKPGVQASVKELEQIEDYVHFMRDFVSRTSDPELESLEVVGYLLCGDLVDTWKVREKRRSLSQTRVYVRRYRDLLQLVENNHEEFLTRYDRLRALKNKEALGENEISAEKLVTAGEG